jgi:uncharacterized RDD family membrane protein YckC
LASSRRRPGYAHPEGEWTAVAAPLWRRSVASGIDWGLAAVLYLLLLIPAGMLEVIGGLFEGAVESAFAAVGHLVAVSAIVAYFTFLLRSGHTLGMRALDIHVFAHGSGREPGLPRSFARGLLALGLGVAVLNAYSYLRGWEPVAGLSATERAVGEVSVVAAAVAILGELWMLVDPERRTLWDRLTGLVVVEDVVPASLPDRLWRTWST